MGMLEDLIAQLDALDGREVTVVQRDAGKSVDDALVEKVVARLNRKGGPKIASHVIAD